MYYQILFGIYLFCLIVEFVLIGMLLNQNVKDKRFYNSLNRKMHEMVEKEEVEEEE